MGDVLKCTMIKGIVSNLSSRGFASRGSSYLMRSDHLHFTNSCDFPISRKASTKLGANHNFTSQQPCQLLTQHSHSKTALQCIPTSTPKKSKKARLHPTILPQAPSLTSRRLRRYRCRPRRMPCARLPLESHRQLHRLQVQSEHVPESATTRAHTAE